MEIAGCRPLGRALFLEVSISAGLLCNKLISPGGKTHLYHGVRLHVAFDPRN